MVLCPPFRFSRKKGRFDLNNAPDLTRTRESFAIIPGPQPNQNGTKKETSFTENIPVPSSVEKPKHSNSISHMSTQSIPDVDTSSLEDSKRTVSQGTIPENDDLVIKKQRKGVIAPPAPDDRTPSLAELNYVKYEKDPESQEQIRVAVMANDFLKNLMDKERLVAVVEAMSSQLFTAGSLIIREGESGSHLYVSAYGQFEVLKNGKVVKKLGKGEVFGELAILYKAKRFATIRCITEAKVWMLERRVFQKIMVRSGRQEQEDNLRFLSSVPLLKNVHQIELSKISGFLKREFFSAGTAVVRQGDPGEKFYIIRGGTVVVTKREGEGDDQQVGVLGRGDFFGEQALLHTERRLATVTAQPPGVECLTLERRRFKEFFGGLDVLISTRHVVPDLPKPKTSYVKTEFEYVQLEDLGIVGTMGVGGFGRVELVQYKHDKNLTFALKCLKKIDMVQQQQQEHAYNEKKIMFSCQSRFICRLYKTLKNNMFIYFLMEPILGGDLWTLLQKHRYFTENTARFMAACVVEAFHYLHEKHIVYRDLKPENLMLDENGYVKLVDFGFAKQLLPNSKTWTFAGTPEYVAPEIVLNKGHDRAIDCWALGVFIHEILVGKPPFRAPGGDHMKTYTLILNGIDAVAFNPTRVSKSAQQLIKKLCRPVPAERIGYLKNGMNDVKKHKFFQGFDWEVLREGKMKAPLIPPVASKTDLSNFDKYPKEQKNPPQETSGWDIDF